MSPASFTPEQDLHFVLCDFGRSGQAYVETDPSQADASTIVRNLLEGQYNRPVRVLALNVEEGWVRDVSEVIAQGARRHPGGPPQVGGLFGFKFSSRPHPWKFGVKTISGAEGGSGEEVGWPVLGYLL